MKNKLLKVSLTGLKIGFLASALLISGSQLYKRTYEHNFRDWLEETRKERTISIKGDYESVDNLSGAFVCIFESKKTGRNEPLFTDCIETCCGLALDNKLGGLHYLGHFSSADDWRDIRNSITNKFSNLKEFRDFKALEPIVIEGVKPNLIATRNVYKALKSLDLLRETRYCRSERVLIKDGELYSVKW